MEWLMGKGGKLAPKSFNRKDLRFLVTDYASRITHYASRITHHVLRFTPAAETGNGSRVTSVSPASANQPASSSSVCFHW